MNHIEVVAAIIRKEDKVFATQRGYGEWKDWWEFPGGKMEPGELPQDALKREIREELSTEINTSAAIMHVSWGSPPFGSGSYLYNSKIIIPRHPMDCERKMKETIAAT